MARVTKHPHVRRDEMMDAALQLCAEVGYETMSIEHVTSAVGVAKGTFYYHFGSKTDLLVATIERWVTELMSDLEAAAPHLTGTAAQRFGALMSLGSQWKQERIDGVLGAFPLLYKPENLELRHRLFDAWTARTRPLFLPMLEQGQADGSFAIEDSQATVDVLLALFTDGSSRLMDRALGASDADAFAQTMARGTRALMTAAERVLGAAPGSFALPQDYAATFKALYQPLIAALGRASGPNREAGQ